MDIIHDPITAGMVKTLIDRPVASSGLILKQQLITETGTWTRPAKMAGNTVWLTMIGGGQSGASAQSWATGGNSGVYVVEWPVDIGGVVQVPCTVGGGGVSVVSHMSVSGQPSSFGEFLSVAGGGSGLGNMAHGGRSSNPYNDYDYGASEASVGAASQVRSSFSTPGGGGLIVGPNSPAGSPFDSRGFGAGGSSTVGSSSAISKKGNNGCILVQWSEFI